MISIPKCLLATNIGTLLRKKKFGHRFFHQCPNFNNSFTYVVGLIHHGYSFSHLRLTIRDNYKVRTCGVGLPLKAVSSGTHIRIC